MNHIHLKWSVPAEYSIYLNYIINININHICSVFNEWCWFSISVHNIQTFQISKRIGDWELNLKHCHQNHFLIPNIVFICEIKYSITKKKIYQIYEFNCRFSVIWCSMFGVQDENDSMMIVVDNYLSILIILFKSMKAAELIIIISGYIITDIPCNNEKKIEKFH